jgi:hypothetical protein
MNLTKCAVVVPFATGLLSVGSSNSGSSTSTSATILFVPLLAFLSLLIDYFSFLGGGFFITT